MRIGVPKESEAGEARVALVPEVLPKLKRLALEISIQSGAGMLSGFADEAYTAKGGQVKESIWDAGLITAIHPPALENLSKGSILICMANPLRETARVKKMADRGITCFALELIPRISRAQAMDVLSSMANVAGYKAVLLAATRLPKLFPLIMTAAGTVRPARVFVLGAGVAGLQAIATARRLGAVVEAYDVRGNTKEQVESLGARFIEFDLGAGNMQDAGGYAKELTEPQKKRQAELMKRQIQAADAVITTAQVPGREAPLLIPAEVVEGMKPGAVIVDMAAESGGNCALSEAGKEVVKHGVTILGPANLPSSVAQSASQLYANNVVSFLGCLIKEGRIELNLEDEVVRSPLVCHRGEITSERVREGLT